MTTIEMIKNLALRNNVVASADVLAVFAELEAKSQRITGLERHVKDIEATLIAATDEIADIAIERDEARARLATPVRLTDERTLWAGEDDYDTGHVKGWNANRIEQAALLKKQGFKVEGDE